MAHRHFLSALAVTVVLGAAACGRPETGAVDGDLKRDLDMAGAASVQMTRTTPRTQVVSAIEGGEAPETPAPKATPRPDPRPTVARHAPSPRRAPSPVVQVAEREEPAPAPEPTPTPEPTPAPVETREPVTVAPAPAPAPEPAPAPRQIPSPRGRGGRGTWTVGDVIRNAPFPILP